MRPEFLCQPDRFHGKAFFGDVCLAAWFLGPLHVLLGGLRVLKLSPARAPMRKEPWGECAGCATARWRNVTLASGPAGAVNEGLNMATRKDEYKYAAWAWRYVYKTTTW